jgi:amino acid permease
MRKNIKSPTIPSLTLTRPDKTNQMASAHEDHRTGDGGNTFELNALEANGKATSITRNSSVNREVNNASDRRSEQELSENEERARRFRPRHIQMMALGTRAPNFGD